MPTLTIAGTLSFPIADEANPQSAPFSFTQVYTEKTTNDLALAGTESDVDILGGIADAKAVYLELISGQATIEVNGAAMGVDLEPGLGQFLWTNPSGGLTALTVTSSGAGTLRIYVFS